GRRSDGDAVWLGEAGRRDRRRRMHRTGAGPCLWDRAALNPPPLWYVPPARNTASYSAVRVLAVVRAPGRAPIGPTRGGFPPAVDPRRPPREGPRPSPRRPAPGPR